MTSLHAPDNGRYTFVPGASDLPTIVGGKGVWLHTADGREILDAAGGAIVNNVGWGRPEVGEAIAAATSNAAYSVPLWPTTHRLALRDEMVEHWLPAGFDHVFFASGGSESNDSALRLARAYQLAKGRERRWKVIGRHPSYHGMTVGTVAVASHDGRQRGYEPLLLPFPKVPWDDADALRAVFEDEDPDTIAGFIAEPITGAAGACLSADDHYWRTLNELCRQHEVLLIADEVMTGFGRTGVKFGHQHFPVEPDVIVGGKGLGGGYVPLGAVAARNDVAEALRGSGFMYFTFSGNDIACAAGVKVLELLRTERLVERSAQMGEVLGQALRNALGSHPSVADIRGRGLFYGVELNISRDAVVAAAWADDMWVYPAGSGPVPQAVMIAPAFVVTEGEISEIVTRLTRVIDRCS
jgi:adenosylmethionine-8-amino-7-oxononanoate aminotransferase